MTAPASNPSPLTHSLTPDTTPRHGSPRASGDRGATADYHALREALEALLEGERHWLANLANFTALVHERLTGLNWVGFYLLHGDELVLGPFQGKVACVRIPVGKGVCGTAALRRASVRVPDVHAFPGHIACDPLSASELVVPLLHGDRLLGVLDLDAPHRDFFREEDRVEFETLVRRLVTLTDWPEEFGVATRQPTSQASGVGVRFQSLWQPLEAHQNNLRRSLQDVEAHWAEKAWLLTWHQHPHHTFTGQGSKTRWFPGGRLNVATQALDLPIARGLGNQRALVWESEATNAEREPLLVRSFTYRELRREVGRLAALLHALGVRAGDRVTIYLPVVPELPIAMLACAWLGAVHNVVFGGFPPAALRERIVDSGSRIILTADGQRRAGKILPLKPIVDAAIQGLPEVERVLVLRHTGSPVDHQEGRDLDWREALHARLEPVAQQPVPSEHPLFIMYTSGSTGKPKGIVHGSAGYLLQTLVSAQEAFDLRSGDVFWCTADPAWITGHTYTVYAPLLAGATTLLVEGPLNVPDWERAWDVIERHRPRVLYTTPTIIRNWRRQGDAAIQRRDTSSLRILGSVGEPIGEAVSEWFRQTVGGGLASVVDTWWQTETGAALVFHPPYVTGAQPGITGLPVAGVELGLEAPEGGEVLGVGSGKLIIKRPWPGMPLGIWNDFPRYEELYWQASPLGFVTGDTAQRDSAGRLRLLGRADDVIKINGHRIGSAEVEAAALAHPAVADAAAVGVPDEQTGEALVLFLVLRPGHAADDALRGSVLQLIDATVGKLARPRTLQWVATLPRNRGGKILRRLLRELIVHGEVRGDVTTLDEPLRLVTEPEARP